jgi:protein-S-isoprenylcysteine O-methyltransferase Ste14
LDFVRACFLYIPLVACAAVVLIGRPDPRKAAGALLALLWAMPSLLILEELARHMHWWRMSAPTGIFPIAADVWLGWAIAWGPLPALVGWRRPLAVLVVAWWVDVTLMPAALNLVVLGREWLVGELVALTFVLLPGVLLTRWTIQRRFLKTRASLQMVIFGAWTLGIVPYAAERVRPSGGSPAWWALPLLAPFGLVAASAVHEFVRRGNGTPLPYDPPDRLVTSGPYAYVSNPMQLSMTIVLLGIAGIMRNPLVAVGALLATAYGSGLAAWHESVTTAKRFGDRWTRYRSEVRAWRPRWRPYVEGGSVVYIARTCDLCSGIGAWIARRRPLGLRIEAAESLELPPRRMLYVPSDGGPSDSGIAAFGRCLEHVNVLWATFGFVLRLPVLRPVIQVFLDACGGGPRVLESQAMTCGTGTLRASASAMP